MDKSKFAEPRAFHVDGGWYDAYWLQQARTSAARRIARAVAVSLAALARGAANMIWARQTIAAMPAELSPCLDADTVARARRLLLSEDETGG